MIAADPTAPLSDQEAASLFQAYSDLPAVAVALSGGPDSMALAFLLSRWSAVRGVPLSIHTLTVDHGLRDESAAEAQQVQAWAKEWPGVTSYILRWDGDKPQARIMEEARRARYDLMADYCAVHDIPVLFVAHHQDDQAETFLIRLAAGSGLDGLSGMRRDQSRGPHLSIARPLLDIPKERLITTCHAHGITYVEDPSNAKEEYLRPRLRASRAVLEEEGLSAKRLSVTAARLARAREALEDMTDQAFAVCHLSQEAEGVLFDFAAFNTYTAEIRLRMILRAMEWLHPDKEYAPRMEKAENLLESLATPDFRGRTLGGCVFAMKDKGQALWVGKE